MKTSLLIILLALLATMSVSALFEVSGIDVNHADNEYGVHPKNAAINGRFKRAVVYSRGYVGPYGAGRATVVRTPYGSAYRGGYVYG